MKRIPELSVRNSMFVNMLTGFIIIAGLISMFGLRKEAFPPVSFDVVTVTTYFRGASADKVEKLVTSPLEREIKEVNNIKEMSSISNEGVSRIFIKIASGVRNTRKVINDIQKAVDRVTDFPKDVDERPIVTEITSGEIPVIKVALSGAMPEFRLRKLADDLRDIFEDISGVASVERVGYRDEEIWVEPDPEKMSRLHISFKEIADALASQNVDSPGGKFKPGNKEYNVKVKSEYRSLEDIKNSIIRANDLGNWLRIKDIARVRPAFEDDIFINKVLGSRAITLTVIKRETGDILKIVKRVRRAINKFKKTAPPSLKISTFYDMSYYVSRRLNVLRSNGIIGFILVAGVLFLFLHPIPAVMTALGIPVAMLATFWIMILSGLTINLITMFGLIVVLGMLVDDGIIISENVYRYIEQGMPVREAAVKGTQEVMYPVLSTVLTTIAAFSPLMFMGGLLGRFVKYIPLVAIIALIASLAEAFVILPSHLSDFSHPLTKGNKGKSEKKWFKIIHGRYKQFLNYCLVRRYKVVVIVLAAFVFSVIAAKVFMPFMLFSSKGVEQFSVRMEAKPGVSLEYTNKLIKKVEEFISKIPPKYLDTYSTLVGRLQEERSYDPNARQASNLAQINVYLTAYSKRDKTAGQIIEMLKPGIKKLFKELKPKGVEKLYFQKLKEGPPVGRPVDVRVRGEDFGVLAKISAGIEAYINSLKGIQGTSTSYDLGANQIDVIIDSEKAAKAFLTNSDIAFAVRSAFAGWVATTIKRTKAEKEIDVLVRFPAEYRNSPDVFDKIYVRNKFDNLVPLKKVVYIKKSRMLNSIRHVGGKRFIAVTADVDNRHITSLRANALIRRKFADLPFKHPGYSLEFSGENEETLESLGNLFKAFIIAFLLIFLILATQFKSFSQPFIVMSAIPLGLIGVIAAFLIHKEPLSFLAILGLVGLTGVVVNDSIVLVDFINKQRLKSTTVIEAIMAAGTLRFRPVILTTLTTVVGLWTVAYGIGGMDPFLRPMALAMSWGLLFATFLTLIVIPCLYAILEDIKAGFKK